MKTIFHCDDIGATPSITTRILDAWKCGLIDGFSVMSNGDAVELLKHSLHSNQKLDARISVHLNLSEGKPVLDPAAIPLLVDDNGYFKFGFGGLAKQWFICSGKKRIDFLEQIEAEFRAQISATREICGSRKLSCLDGHIHIQMLPFIFKIVTRLANESGIDQVRISKEPFFICRNMKEYFSIALFLNMCKFFTLRILSLAAEKELYRCNLSSPDYVVGILFTGQMNANVTQAGITASEKNNSHSTEVIFHIGRASDSEKVRYTGNPKLSHFPLSHERDKEYTELISLRRSLING